MLSLFPQILWLAPFSALLIRLAVAVFLAYGAWQHFGMAPIFVRLLSIIEFVVALALIAGAGTQAAALVGLVICAKQLLAPSLRATARSTVALALVMCASLIVTGPGALAFDLPL